MIESAQSDDTSINFDSENLNKPRDQRKGKKGGKDQVNIMTYEIPSVEIRYL